MVFSGVWHAFGLMCTHFIAHLARFTALLHTVPRAAGRFLSALNVK
jgi:hypothetical protein